MNKSADPFKNYGRPIALLTIILLVESATLPAAEFDQSHAAFDAVLKDYVKSGRVNYRGLNEHRQGLESYLDQLATLPKSEFARWNEKEQTALLINAYNAFTLRLIIDHYPVKSIKDIGNVL